MKGKKKIQGSLHHSLNGKVVLLGLTGSIAVYKSCEIVRKLREEGAEVFCLMSPGAQKFVTPLTFSALSEHPVATDLWQESLWKTAHLELAERGDIFIIAPASANSIAKMANGLSDDVLSATLCASKMPVLIAPAMHENMWLNPSTQANVKRLKSYGYRFEGPGFGALARRGEGWGRLADTEAIIEAAKEIVAKKY